MADSRYRLYFAQVRPGRWVKIRAKTRTTAAELAGVVRVYTRRGLRRHDPETHRQLWAKEVGLEER